MFIKWDKLEHQSSKDASLKKVSVHASLLKNDKINYAKSKFFL